MKDDRELAAIIARKIFEAGDASEKCERIQFMCGKYPERPSGGFSEGPLTDFITAVLKRHRSY